MIQAWLWDFLFMFSVHLKPEHLESLCISDLLYEVHAGDVLGLKALIADSQIPLGLVCRVGNGWIWMSVVVQQTDPGHLCVLVSGTNQFSIMVGVRAVWKPDTSR